MDNTLNFPIYGGITTKRGTYYRYVIKASHKVEVWKDVCIKTLVPRRYKERSIMVNPTKEILSRLSEEYGFEVKA